MANIEPDIELDVRALQSNPVVKGTRKPKKNSLNGSNPNSGGGNGSGASGSGNNTKAYPSSRGLVPKWDRWAPDLLDWMSVVAVILFICQCLIYLFASSHFSYQNAFNWLIFTESSYQYPKLLIRIFTNFLTNFCFVTKAKLFDRLKNSWKFKIHSFEIGNTGFDISYNWKMFKPLF